MNPLSLAGISKSFQGSPVLRDVSWTMQPGTITGLLGNNGAGKTTLMQIALGLIAPDSGEVELFGESVAGASSEARHRVGYVPQTMDSFLWMTVDRCIRYVGAFYSDWDDELIMRLSDVWQLPGQTRVHQLSVGERQKLSILLAMGHHPELLLLDEPVASLDPGSRREFLREIVSLNERERQAVLFSTHITSDLERIAGDVLILHHGVLRYAGPLDDLKERVVRMECGTNLDESDPLVADKVIRSQRDGNQMRLTVQDWSDEQTDKLREHIGAPISVQHLSLEEIFLELTV